ncbi:GH32 C-terminal domain-containing protein [Burkholderia ambifaria]|nr:GH32 C-terminal domain-containing protein [Burkholderia ambifaria]
MAACCLNSGGKRTSVLARQTPLHGDHSRQNQCPNSFDHYTSDKSIYDSAQRAGLIVRGSANGDVGTWIFYDTASQTLTLDRSRSGNIRFSKAFSKQHIVNMPLENGKSSRTCRVANAKCIAAVKACRMVRHAERRATLNYVCSSTDAGCRANPIGHRPDTIKRLTPSIACS